MPKSWGGAEGFCIDILEDKHHLMAVAVASCSVISLSDPVSKGSADHSNKSMVHI